MGSSNFYNTIIHILGSIGISLKVSRLDWNSPAGSVEDLQWREEEAVVQEDNLHRFLRILSDIVEKGTCEDDDCEGGDDGDELSEIVEKGTYEAYREGIRNKLSIKPSTKETNNRPDEQVTAIKAHYEETLQSICSSLNFSNIQIVSLQKKLFHHFPMLGPFMAYEVNEKAMRRTSKATSPP